MWVAYAFASALFAGITAILAKIGLKNVDSHVATAIRTVVVAVFAWIMVFVAGSFSTIGNITLKTLFFLILSGIATGASWLCYFYALQKAEVSRVTPIDKSSTILTMLLAWVFLKETQGVPQVIGMVGIAIGTVMMVMPRKGKDLSNEKNDEVLADEEFVEGAINSADEIERNVECEDTTGVSESKQEDNGMEELRNEEKKSSVIENASVKTPVKRGFLPFLKPGRNYWFLAAVGSAVFASLTSILGKVGIEKVESNLGTAIRTIVVLVMAWILVEVTDHEKDIKKLTKKNYVFLVLSGITTGLSWLCYYHALQKGKASVVMPIDKLSILVTIGFSSLILKEHLSRKALIGLIFLTAGTLFLLF